MMIQKTKGFTLIRTLLRKNLAFRRLNVRTWCRQDLVSVHGFTLIELLVVISIIGVLIALTVAGLTGSRQQARDARRKADLETIRSGLELHWADCSRYPSSLTAGSPLVGVPTPAGCTGTYIASVPDDPNSSNNYYYAPLGSPPNSYTVCAALEQSPGVTPPVSCVGSSQCGATCNYGVTNP